MFALASGQSAEYFRGYTEEISGTSFAYHSPLPDVTSALLMRGRSDFQPIRWRTEVVPDSYQADKISFVWLYGMDADPEPVPFTLKVNGKEWFSFSNPLKGEIVLGAGDQFGHHRHVLGNVGVLEDSHLKHDARERLVALEPLRNLGAPGQPVVSGHVGLALLDVALR